jgi:FkbM family methyltransferase
MREALRRIGAHPLLSRHVARALRGLRTTQPVRFQLRDARGHGRHIYTVKEAGRPVVLEHGTPDIATFDQAFYQHAYEPPAAVAAGLEGLGRPLRVLDLGANVGMFSVWVAHRFAVERVTAVEPLPRNARQLRETLDMAQRPGERFDVVEAAAGVSDGSVRFGGGDTTTGRVVDEGEGDAGGVEVAVKDFFGLATEDVDLVKIDIEGAEWPIVADPRFRELRATAVMLEHHPHAAPGEPARAAEAALDAAGYAWERTSLDDGGPGTGTLWAVKRPA